MTVAELIEKLQRAPNQQAAITVYLNNGAVWDEFGRAVASRDQQTVYLQDEEAEGGEIEL